MNRPNGMAEVLNTRTYFSPDVVKSYNTYDLTRTEATVLLEFQSSFAGKDVLDIGIGTGRTTVYLAPLARRYVGIDFSPAFIDFINSTMPEIQAQLGRMQDLKQFGADEFDFVMGSFNVIDAVEHEDRIRTLSEVHRVLRPRGIFVFSSHNRTWELAGSGPRLRRSKDPVRQAWLVLRWSRQFLNHAKVKKYRVFNDDYAMLNDEGHDFYPLHYYVDQVAQRRQLEENNFTVLGVYDATGHKLTPEAVATSSPCLMYVAQKKA